MRRPIYVAVGSCGLLVLSMACGRQSASPTSPSSASAAAEAKDATVDGSTLKVSAPTPISPTNNAVVESSTVTLVSSAAAGTFIPGTMAYDFELYDQSDVKVRTEVVAGTSWVVAGLEFAGAYHWRVRATSDEAYGPWSDFATFTTPENRGYLRGNELFDPLTNGQTVSTRMNLVTFIPNVGLRLDNIESFIEYRLQTPLTDGQFSVTVTNLGNSNEQWKTKLMSMLQADGVNVTDNAYRFTADRRNADSGGTVRYTLRSRGVDAGEPNCGGAGWSRSNLYLWTYTWNGGNSNLKVQNGGPTGPTVRSCGASYRAPYSPNPHLIRLGSVGGRGGSETLAGAIFRNVWVSPAQRPVFPGDTP